MDKRTILFMIAALCLYLSAIAGHRHPVTVHPPMLDSIQPLSIGDTVPNLPLPGVTRANGATAHLADFKNKVVILDFWATWCSPCVAMLPKMDSLQRMFDGQLQVIAVTYQPDSIATPFLERIQQQRDVTYSFAYTTGDTVLARYFKHHTLPHYVWLSIDSVGKANVIAITDSDQVSAINVKDFISGASHLLPAKVDLPRYAYDWKQPLFYAHPTMGPPNPTIMQAVFTPYKEGFGSGYYQTITSGVDTVPYRRITFRNLYMVRMYQLVVDSLRSVGWNRTVLKVREPEKLIKWAQGQEYTDWLRNHGYCFELIVPKQLASQATTLMRQQLDAYFTDYRVVLEDTVRDCLVLHRTTSQEKFKSGGGDPRADFGFDGCTLVNRPGGFALLTSMLGLKYLHHLATPLINETDYKGAIDLSIQAPLNDVPAINRELSTYGLALTIQPRKIKVLVIYDKEAQP